MNEYTPNSHKFKTEQREAQKEKKEIKKVVKGTVRTKKKSRLKDVFISEDAGNVKSYVFMDVLVPAIKKAISDIVTDGIDMILYGEAGHRKKSSSGTKVSYRNFYDKKDDRRVSDSRTRSLYSYEDIILETRGEAEEVLSQMEDIIDAYGIVSVSDLYEMVGINNSYTSNKYGWSNLRNAEVVRVRDGYLLKLPRAMPID